jgi:hypothetical protein
VRAAAEESLFKREAGAIVADIVFDSLVDSDDGAANGHVRRLRFGRASARVEFEIGSDGDGQVLLRVVAGAHPATPLTVCHADGVVETRTDAAGAATVEIVPGLASVVIRPAGGAPVQTAWVKL